MLTRSRNPIISRGGPGGGERGGGVIWGMGVFGEIEIWRGRVSWKGLLDVGMRVLGSRGGARPDGYVGGMPKDGCLWYPPPSRKGEDTIMYYYHPSMYVYCIS